jgi:hypothetical protein
VGTRRSTGKGRRIIANSYGRNFHDRGATAEDALIGHTKKSRYTYEHLLPSIEIANAISYVLNKRKITEDDVEFMYKAISLICLVTKSEDGRLPSTTIPNPTVFYDAFEKRNLKTCFDESYRRYKNANVNIAYPPNITDDIDVHYEISIDTFGNPIKIRVNGKNYRFAFEENITGYSSIDLPEITRMQELAGIREFDEFNADDFDFDDEMGDMRKMGFNHVMGKDQVEITMIENYHLSYNDGEADVHLVKKITKTVDEINEALKSISPDEPSMNDREEYLEFLEDEGSFQLAQELMDGSEETDFYPNQQFGINVEYMDWEEIEKDASDVTYESITYKFI